jgi:SAM-dependent methyltransferase
MDTVTKETVCTVCGCADVSRGDTGAVRGNTEKYAGTAFRMAKCPDCGSIHALDPVDYGEIYRDYPLNRERRLDGFARGTMRNLLRRCVREGMTKTDSVLDYGCGNGVFVEFLRASGFDNATGYDPYVPGFQDGPRGLFRWVIVNDVIEHVDDPRRLIRDAAALTAPGGYLYVGTCDSHGVDMNDMERHRMRLHQPYHRVLVSRDRLVGLGHGPGLEVVRQYLRSYMDTMKPFVNYRFLDEVSRALGHNLDRMLDPSESWKAGLSPRVLAFGLLGYFFPSAFEPAVVYRKREAVIE